MVVRTPGQHKRGSSPPWELVDAPATATAADAPPTDGSESQPAPAWSQEDAAMIINSIVDPMQSLLCRHSESIYIHVCCKTDPHCRSGVTGRLAGTVGNDACGGSTFAAHELAGGGQALAPPIGATRAMVHSTFRPALQRASAATWYIGLSRELRRARACT
jgi:hypothetical protein